MKTNDESLIDRTLDGDVEAFLHIIERYMDFVYYTCGRRVMKYGFLNQLVQKVFNKLWEDLPSLRKQKNLTKYILCVTQKIIADYIFDNYNCRDSKEKNLLRIRICEILNNETNESGITIYGIRKSGFSNILTKEECNLLMYYYSFSFSISIITNIVNNETQNKVYDSLVIAKNKLLSLIPDYVAKCNTSTSSIVNFLSDFLKTIRDDKVRLTPKKIFWSLPGVNPPSSPCTAMINMRKTNLEFVKYA